MMVRELRLDGDVCVIEIGQGHAIENNSDKDLVFMALIYNK